jgi:hypothetical protein
MVCGLQHSKGVLRFWRQPATLMALLVLLGDPFAVCAGWLSTPEARLACCADDQDCPMHKSDHRPSGSSHAVSQADADRCCALSEHDDSLPSSAKVTGAFDSLVLIPSVLPIAFVSPLARVDELHEPASSPPSGRSRHLLLSVFLI